MGHIKELPLDKVEIDISILKRKNIRVQVARGVREACPESETRRDLGAYLQRIALYCHQLDICSKVEGGRKIVAEKNIYKIKAYENIVR